MRKATELLADYAQYHRDERNIITHLIGVPMIVLAVAILLSRPSFELGGVSLTPAWVALALSAIWYLTRGVPVLALATSLMVALMVVVGTALAARSTGVWLGSGIGLFVIGWSIQLLGHYYEGRKPAFVDDVTGLMTGPMFVVAEGLFACGWNRSLLAEIERRAGPTHLRDIPAALLR